MMDKTPASPADEPALTEFMLYTPEQVAIMTGLSVHTLRRLAKQGKIPHKRVERNAMRFNVRDIQALHDYFTVQSVAATPTDSDDLDTGPFNFTGRGQAIARNKECPLQRRPAVDH